MHVIFTTMYARLQKVPNYSFFLFGPRGTGKTTWLRENLKNTYWKNLLLDQDYLPLLADASLLSKEVESLPENSWVIIDEVQRLPSLLNEIHNLISLHGQKYKFAISGSSARKLKRLDSNLLAGRAIEKKMYSLVSKELGDDFNLNRVLTYGCLPVIWPDNDLASDILNTYVGTYLKQEIQQEALLKDIGAFHRFLKVCGICNSQVINVSNIAKDASVSRNTTERYLDILVDTLIAFRLPGWQPRLKVREQLRPKFYFFDPGIVRSLTGRIYTQLNDLEVGSLMETFILNELRAYIEYQAPGSELYYYRTAAGLEVDFILVKGDEIIAVEVKSSQKWRSEYNRGLKELAKGKNNIKLYGIYRGQNKLKFDELIVYPVKEFLEALWENLL